MKPLIKEAIALEYGNRPTPIVTAKGQDELAQRILEEARQHGVYVAEDPQLVALLSRILVTLANGEFEVFAKHALPLYQDAPKMWTT